MALPHRSHERSQPHPSAMHKGLMFVKNHVDLMLHRMKKEPNFTPERDDLIDLSRQVVELIQKYHPKITSEEKQLLMAVIDLNDAPQMQSWSQRISFEVALKDAAKNLEQYLENNH